MIVGLLLFLIKGFIAFYAILIIGYLIGRYFSLLNINERPSEGLFIASIIGILLPTLIYALIVTKGNTVLWGLLLLLILFKFENRNIKNEPIKLPDPKLILGLATVFSFILIYQVFENIYDFKSGYLKVSPYRDSIYYGAIAAGIKNFGVESTQNYSAFLSAGVSNTVTPYHYIELHFTSFLSSICNESAITTYHYLTKTLYVFICFLGILTLMERYTSSNPITRIIFGLLSLFFCGFVFNEYYFTSIWGYLGYSTFSIISYKMAFYFPFTIGAVHFGLKKNYNASIAMLGILMLSNIAFFPALSAGISLLLIIPILLKRREPRNGRLLLFWLSTITFISAFYLLQVKLPFALESISLSDSIQILTLKKIASYFIDNYIKLFLIYFPFVIFLFIDIKIKKIVTNPVLIGSFLLVNFGLLAWILNLSFFNSWQFFTLIGGLALNTLCFCYFAYAFTFSGFSKFLRVGLLPICIVFTIVNFQDICFSKEKVELPYTNEFLNEVKIALEKGESLKGLSLCDEEEISFRTLSFVHNAPGNYLYSLSDKINLSYFLPGKSLPDVLNDSEIYALSSPYYLFASLNKNLSDDEVFKMFVQKEKVSFLTARLDTPMPDYIQKCVLQKIISNHTNDVFILLKND